MLVVRLGESGETSGRLCRLVKFLASSIPIDGPSMDDLSGYEKASSKMRDQGRTAARVESGRSESEGWVQRG